MKPRPKRSARQRLVKQLDDAFSLFIRNRDGWTCVTCGDRDRSRQTCGHLFSRTSYGTRWDETNAFDQCSGCNLRHEYDAGPLTIVYLKHYGQDAYERLHFRANATTRYTQGDLELLLAHYRARVAEMTCGMVRSEA